jgi:hypothetical protein
MSSASIIDRRTSQVPVRTELDEWEYKVNGKYPGQLCKDGNYHKPFIKYNDSLIYEETIKQALGFIEQGSNEPGSVFVPQFEAFDTLHNRWWSSFKSHNSVSKQPLTISDIGFIALCHLHVARTPELRTRQVDVESIYHLASVARLCLCRHTPQPYLFKRLAQDPSLNNFFGLVANFIVFIDNKTILPTLQASGLPPLSEEITIEIRKTKEPKWLTDFKLAQHEKNEQLLTNAERVARTVTLQFEKERRANMTQEDIDEEDKHKVRVSDSEHGEMWRNDIGFIARNFVPILNRLFYVVWSIDKMRSLRPTNSHTLEFTPAARNRMNNWVFNLCNREIENFAEQFRSLAVEWIIPWCSRESMRRDQAYSTDKSKPIQLAGRELGASTSEYMQDKSFTKLNEIKETHEFFPILLMSLFSHEFSRQFLTVCVTTNTPNPNKVEFPISFLVYYVIEPNEIHEPNSMRRLTLPYEPYSKRDRLPIIVCESGHSVCIDHVRWDMTVRESVKQKKQRTATRLHFACQDMQHALYTWCEIVDKEFDGILENGNSARSFLNKFLTDS